jgi:hypothetical protein
LRAHSGSLLAGALARHGITEPALVQHLYALRLAFVEETLLGPGPSAP